jgi:plastocyanin
MNNIYRKISLLTLLIIITIFFAACGANVSNSRAETEATADFTGEQEQAASAPAETSAETPAETPAADAPTQDVNPENHSDRNAEVPSNTTADPSSEMPANTTEESPADTPAENAEAPTAESVGENHVVEIANFAFAPAKLTIKTGDTVTFINKDPVKHTATADDSSFDTGLIGQDKEVQIAFDKAGEFSYFCAPHPAMKGSVIVKVAD